jgi:hypothetical protein
LKLKRCGRLGEWSRSLRPGETRSRQDTNRSNLLETAGPSGALLLCGEKKRLFMRFSEGY